jgi:hypothetical protein
MILLSLMDRRFGSKLLGHGFDVAELHRGEVDGLNPTMLSPGAYVTVSLARSILVGSLKTTTETAYPKLCRLRAFRTL